jgi:hypothetical protein
VQIPRLFFFRFSRKILKIKKYHSKESAEKSIGIHFQLAVVYTYYHEARRKQEIEAPPVLDY